MLVGAIAAFGMILWRRKRAEMGVCVALRDVKSLQQLRTSFQKILPASHVAAFTAGWLIKPKHAAVHQKLLYLLRRRTVKLDHPKRWVPATGLARLQLAEADDILPVLLGESDTFGLLQEDAFLVVRFRILPRGRQTLRSRLFGPLLSSCKAASLSVRPVVLWESTQQASRTQRTLRIAPHPQAPTLQSTSTVAGSSPPRLARSTRRPRLPAVLPKEEDSDTGRVAVSHRRPSCGRATSDKRGADGAKYTTLQSTPSAEDVYNLQLSKTPARTLEKAVHELEAHDVGKRHRLPTSRSHCSQHRLDLSEQGEERLSERLPGDTHTVAEMLLDEALWSPRSTGLSI